MNVEIYGAGIAGAYFANLLQTGGHYDYRIYEIHKKPDCRCAWGWANFSKVHKYVKYVGLNADDYVLSRPKKAIVNGIEFKIRDVVTFDKIKFIEDLRELLVVEYYHEPPAPFADMVVDATGHKRAIIGQSPYDKMLETRQYRISDAGIDDSYIYIYGKPYGYAWAFPIGDDWHIGAGAFTVDQCYFLLTQLITKYGFKDKGYGICQCKRPIRWAPEVNKVKICASTDLLPSAFVAIGEAGGFTSGFGEGNTLAMETAFCLYRAIDSYPDDPARAALYYVNLATKETEWIKVQYDFIRTLNKSWFKALFKVPKVIKIANMRNLETSVWAGLKLMWSLRGDGHGQGL